MADYIFSVSADLGGFVDIDALHWELSAASTGGTLHGLTLEGDSLTVSWDTPLTASGESRQSAAVAAHKAATGKLSGDLLLKTYDSLSALRTGDVQRRERLSDASETLAGMLTATETAGDVVAAEAIRDAYLSRYTSAIDAYYIKGYVDWVTGAAPSIATDKDAWLDHDLSVLGLAGLTIRDSLLQSLTA